MCHKIIQRNDLPLSQRAGIDSNCTALQKNYNSGVDNYQCERVHQRGEFARVDLKTEKLFASTVKCSKLLFLAAKGTQNTNAHKVFAHGAGHAVQLRLNFSVFRDGCQHDRKNNGAKQHYNARKNECAACVDCERHYHCTENNKRGAQKQAQRKVDARLNLVDIACHARYQSGNAESIKHGVGKTLNFFQQSGAKVGAEADCSLCRKKLRRYGTEQADRRKCQKQKPHINNEAFAFAVNAVVNNCSNDERHKKLKCCFQKFEKRSQNAFLSELFHVYQKFLHFHFHLCIQLLREAVHPDGTMRLHPSARRNCALFETLYSKIKAVSI